MRNVRGGPADFDARLARLRTVREPSAGEPLRFLGEVLEHQRLRAASGEVQAAAALMGAELTSNRLVERFPLLELHQGTGAILAELAHSVAAGAAWERTPGPLVEAARSIEHREAAERRALVEAWLDDPSLVEARLALWIRVAAGPILEVAASRVQAPTGEEWAGPACPMCGDTPQCSAIIEESGGFMQGAPRYLICGRCATWWHFPRAKCASCLEDDSRRITSYSAEPWPWARIDVCDTCRSYIKTFDLRERDAVKVIPLVDDVASLSLDVWAHGTGLRRLSLSMAGV